MQLPVARTPLRTLEDMKLLLQKLSLPRFALSPTSSSQPNTPPPPSLTRRLFTRGRSATFTPNTPPDTRRTPAVANTPTTPTTPTLTPDDTPKSLTPAQTRSPSPSPAPSPSQLRAPLTGACGQTNPSTDRAIKNDHSTDMDEDDEDSESEEEQLLYEAESPDEAALVQAARAYGFTLLGRSPEQILVSMPATGPLAVPLLHLLPFHSARKLMSVLVRHPITGQVVLYTKGADNVVMDLVCPDAGMRAHVCVCVHGCARACVRSHEHIYVNI